MNKSHSYEKFRQLLQDEFLKRIGKNPAYSIRAYAKSLDINDSTLSKIINRKIPITKDRFEQLSKKLPIKQNADFFSMTSKQFIELDFQKIRMLENWYYPAILELCKTDNYDSSPKLMAKRLGISLNELKIAIKDLKDLELLTEDLNGQLECKSNHCWDGDLSEEMRQAHRNLQYQLLSKAQESMFNVDASLKENSSLTIACDPGLLPEVKKEIEKFQSYIDEFIMSKNQETTEVYQLNINFFPLTKIGDE